MQTFNSFNELAVGQQPLHSDMSVFNAATHRQLQSLEKALDIAYTEIARAYADIEKSDGLKGLKDYVPM